MSLDNKIESSKEVTITKEIQEKLKLKEGDMLEVKKERGNLL